MLTDELEAEDKPSTLPPETEHSRLKAQAGTGAGLIEQGGQDLAATGFCIGGRVPDDVVSQVQYPVDFGYAQVGGINKMTHEQYVTERSTVT